MAAVNTGAAIAFEQPKITMRFQLLHPHFDQARLGYDGVRSLVLQVRCPTGQKSDSSLCNLRVLSTS